MASHFYLLFIFCGLAFAIQSYHPHGRTHDDLIISDFRIKLDAREQEFMPSASFLVSPEKYKRPVHHDFEYRTDRSGSRLKYSYGVLGYSKTATSTATTTVSKTIYSAISNDIEHDKNNENSYYIVTPPVIQFRFGVVADLDEFAAGKIALGNDDPRASQVWVSYLKQGVLSIQQNRDDPDRFNVTVEWDIGKPQKILSGLNYAGRGMELSTLNVFDNKLLACDDKTGIVFELPTLNGRDFSDIVPRPRTILAAINSTTKVYQCEWATIKDNELWVGSHGYSEVNEMGEMISNPKQFIQRITRSGVVTSHDWSRNFDKMREVLYVPKSGYVRHESGLWSDILQKWIFTPRRVSKEKFEIHSFERSGSNVVILADENFKNVQVRQIGDLIPTHGYGDTKFLPGTGDQVIVALKVVETTNIIESYIMAFDLDGNILMEETKFSDQKFEGIEFL